MNNDLTVLRVLYVEDNPADAELAQRVLARVAPWIDLDIASTIAEAKATLQQAELPDVLATDLHLADGSGIELVSWLRTCGRATTWATACAKRWVNAAGVPLGA